MEIRQWNSTVPQAETTQTHAGKPHILRLVSYLKEREKLFIIIIFFLLLLDHQQFQHSHIDALYLNWTEFLNLSSAYSYYKISCPALLLDESFPATFIIGMFFLLFLILSLF